MADSQAQAAPTASTPAAPVADASPFRRRAAGEVDAYRKTAGVAIEEKLRDGTVIYPNPLDWWKENAADFPLLSALARRLLAIPATQAQSERTFSSAGQIITKTRNRLDPDNLDPDNLDLLVGTDRRVEDSWGLIDEWRKSNAASLS